MATLQTTANDGTQIRIEGAGIEMPNIEAPSNKQIETMLTEAQMDLEREKMHLDTHGKNIVSSTQGVLDATSTLLKEKNKEERFQKLYLFTRGSVESGPSEGLQEAVQRLMAQATGIGSKISDNASDVFTYIRETIFNLTTSSEFRDLAIEFLNLLQSMMGQLKSAIAEKDDNESLGEKLRTKIFDSDDEQMEDISERLSNLLGHVSQQEQYQRVVRNFMKYSEQIYDVLYKAKEDSSRTKEVEDLRRVLDEAWEILNDFTGREKKLVPKFRRHLTEVLEKIQNDEELLDWSRDCKRILIDLMENPDNVQKNKDQTAKMIRRGRDLSSKYREDLEIIYIDAQRIVERIQNDPVVKNFQKQLQQLGRDLALNNRGQPDFFVMERSMSVIKDLIIERFKRVLVDVPIRRVEVRSDNLDVLLTNITAEGTGFIPETLNVMLASFSEFHLQKSPDAIQQFKLQLRVDRIKPQFRKVCFSYVKKSFPSMSDHGVADVLFEGNGLSVDIGMTFIIESGQISKAVLTKCLVILDSITLSIDIAKHDIIDAILAPILQARLRARMEAGIQEFIQWRLVQIVDQLNDWFLTRPFDQMLEKGNETLREVVEEMEKKKKEAQEAELEEARRLREAKREEKHRMRRDTHEGEHQGELSDSQKRRRKEEKAERKRRGEGEHQGELSDSQKRRKEEEKAERKRRKEAEGRKEESGKSQQHVEGGSKQHAEGASKQQQHAESGSSQQHAEGGSKQHAEGGSRQHAEGGSKQHEGGSSQQQQQAEREKQKSAQQEKTQTVTEQHKVKEQPSS